MEVPLDVDEMDVVGKELRRIKEKPKEKRDKEIQKLLSQSGLTSKKFVFIFILFKKFEINTLSWTLFFLSNIRSNHTKFLN